LIGQILAHYEITALLGKGGMGEVYRARDTKLQRDVALKFLPPDFADDKDRLRRFEREAQLLAALSHRNIATIHGLEEFGEHHFLVMELVEGEDLSDRLNRERIGTVDALAIARKIALGMQSAHEKGIIHRDLKPANIKLTAQGGVRILDFGLARTNETGAMDKTVAMHQTDEGAVLGTAPYMSPEQLKGQPVDVRTDIWAFGCVLYEMLTGISPYAAESSPETLANILAHDPDFDRLPGDLPPSVRRVLHRCLEKEADQRWHSIADVRIELDSDEDAMVSPAEVRAPSRRLAAIIAVVAFALGAATTGLLTRQTATTNDDEPVRLMIPVRDEAAVVPLPESSSVAISPDGRFVAYVASSLGGARGVGEYGFENTEIHLRPIDGFESHLIPGTAGGSSPVFSPDGEWIAYLDFHEGTIRKVARTGGTPRTVCLAQDMTFRGAQWADDGNIYFSDAHAVRGVDSDGGEPFTVIEPDASGEVKTYRFPHLLPGTRSMLVMRATPHALTYDDAEILLLDLETGALNSLVQGGMDARYLRSGHIVYGRDGKAFAVPFDLASLQITGPAVEVIESVVTSTGYGSLQIGCSDAGTLVYISGGPEQFDSELLVMHRDGRIEDPGQPTRPYGNVRISPSGNRLAVSVLGANASIWVYEFERGTMSRLVSGWDNFSPIWSRDGTQIAFGSNRMGIGSIDLVAADGSGDPVRLMEFATDPYPMSFLPGDAGLAVSVLSPDRGMDIVLADTDRSIQPLVQTPARELRAQFSPDGRSLVYTSDESGRLEVYVQEYPVTGRRWKLSEDGGDMPRWSHDGQTIYYWSGDELLMVPVESNDPFRPARARSVLHIGIEVQDYDVFPDEERFVVLARRPRTNQTSAAISRPSAQGRMFAAQSPDLHVVLNWFTELERLAPSR
jgi:serine/threonine-protein kinase